MPSGGAAASSIEDIPLATDPDAVPVVLAREIGYDVALLELAQVWGSIRIRSHFEQPRLERSRLEQALRDRGVTLRSTDRSGESAARSRLRPNGDSGQVPVASLRDSWLDRSLRRAAKVAAWVRRSMPSLANRLET